MSCRHTENVAIALTVLLISSATSWRSTGLAGEGIAALELAERSAVGWARMSPARHQLSQALRAVSAGRSRISAIEVTGQGEVAEDLTGFGDAEIGVEGQGMLPVAAG